jgi:hypothetical protein
MAYIPEGCRLEHDNKFNLKTIQKEQK